MTTRWSSRVAAAALAGLLVVLAGGGALPAQAASSTAPGRAPARATTFEAAGYSTQTLRGTYAAADYFFALDGGRRAAGTTTVSLRLRRSPLLRPRSSLTVLAGGVAVTSVPLRTIPPAGGTVRVEVPAAQVGDAGLSLGLRGYLRVTDDRCEDASIPAQWVTVLGTSPVALSPRAAAPDLAQASSVLLAGQAPPSVGIDVSSLSTAPLRLAAGLAASQVGRWAAVRQQDVLLSDEADGSPALVVGARAPQAAGGRIELEGRRLVLGGADDEATVKAGRALTDRAFERVLSGRSVSLSATAPAALPANSLPWTDGAASLAQLGVGEREVVGQGAHEIDVSVDRPADWTIGHDAELVLDVDAATQVHAEGSSVQAVVSGVDLGTQRLQPGLRSYRFAVPDELLDRRIDGRPVRSVDLQLRVVTDIADAECQTVDPAAARVTLLTTSRLVLPHTESAALDVGRFPASVQRGDRITVVLPDGADPVTVLAGLQVCLAVGRWQTPGRRAPELVEASRLTDDQRHGGLVLLGRADAEVGHALDLGAPAVTPTGGSATAVLAVVESPLDEDRSALVVHAEPAGLLLAARSLTRRAGLGALAGQRVGLVGTAPHALVAASGADAPAALAPVVGGDDLVHQPWALPALVGAVAFLVTLLVLARHRWRRRARA